MPEPRNDFLQERIEEKFIDNEIEFDVYQRHKRKINDDIALKSKEINNYSFDVSNLCTNINIFCEISSKINFIWENGTAEVRERMLTMLFPRGVFFDKLNNDYRTENMNSIFEVMCRLTDMYEVNKKRQIGISTDLPLLVAGTGLEPVTFGL